MEISKENYLALKEQKLSRAQIAEKFGMTENQIKRWISNNSLGKKIPRINNPRAFSELTEESCYWAGFLAADGCVDEKDRVRLTLNYDDYSHIAKFKEFAASEHKISENTTTYYRAGIEFTCKPMVKDLKENFNIVPRKTAILNFPDKIPHNLIRHFIRGYFDGDGTVCESFSNVNSKTSTIYAGFCCGSRDFAERLRDIIFSNLGEVIQYQDFDTKINLKFCTNNAKKLLTWMYANCSIYLDRKHEKYIKLVINNDRTTR